MRSIIPHRAFWGGGGKTSPASQSVEDNFSTLRGASPVPPAGTLKKLACLQVSRRKEEKDGRSGKGPVCP